MAADASGSLSSNEDDDDDDGDDEWDVDHDNLPLDKANQTQPVAAAAPQTSEPLLDNDDNWLTALPPKQATASLADDKVNIQKDEDSLPLILVDVTQLDPHVHSKNDRFSVNDPDAASRWKKKLTYEQYAKDAALLADGTVIPVGVSVWKEALATMRDRRPGHYFVPVFPPKQA
jgi:hypothetical protein